MESSGKKLYRSHSQRMLAGVCGGFAEYFDIDVTVVRVVYVLLTLFTVFSGIILYIILMLIMPENRDGLKY